MDSDPVRQLDEAIQRLKDSGGEFPSSSDVATCPPEGILERFWRGEMSPWELEDLARHLIRCPSCGAKINQRIVSIRGKSPPHRRILLIIPVAVALLAGAAVLLMERDPIQDLVLRGERERGNRGTLDIVRGERLRLELRLVEPVSIVVLLLDPKGAFSVLHPQGGDPPVVEGPLVVIPGGDENAWDTSGLDPGMYCILVLASRETLTSTDCTEMKTRLEEMMRTSPERPIPIEDLQQAIGPNIQAIVRLFLVPHPLQEGR